MAKYASAGARRRSAPRRRGRRGRLPPNSRDRVSPELPRRLRDARPRAARRLVSRLQVDGCFAGKTRLSLEGCAGRHLRQGLGRNHSSLGASWFHRRRLRHLPPNSLVPQVQPQKGRAPGRLIRVFGTHTPKSKYANAASRHRGHHQRRELPHDCPVVPSSC